MDGNQVMGGISGSRPTGQAPSGLVASRFDPGRVAQSLFKQALCVEWYLGKLEYRDTRQRWSPGPRPEGFAFAAVPDWVLRQHVDALRGLASAIETQSATTAGRGPKDESAPEGDAQNPADASGATP